MLAKAEIEHRNRGAYDRVPIAMPYSFEAAGLAAAAAKDPAAKVAALAAAAGDAGGHDTRIIAKLSLFPEGPRRTDTLLACWDASIDRCGLRVLADVGKHEMKRMAEGAA